MSFADTFTFARPMPAPYVDATGVTRIAPVDVPRFDHAGPRRPLGLLVEAGAQMGQGDAIALRAQDWSASTEWTVLHEWQASAAVQRDAHYATDPQSMIDAVLGFPGHHIRIAAVAGFLHRYDTWVWALGKRWTLPGLVGDGRGGTVAAQPLQPLVAG